MSIQGKQSYFDIFGLQPRLTIDTTQLRDKFLELSRQHHPDFHATEETAARDESLRQSSHLNNAYKTLRDPQPRAEYLIEISGFDIKSNKNAVPPDLLEEIFDIQEAGEELREARINANAAQLAAAEARVKPLRDQAQSTRDSLKKDLETLFTRYDESVQSNASEDERRKLLQQIRLTLDQTNYLRTVLRNLR